MYEMQDRCSTIQEDVDRANAGTEGLLRRANGLREQEYVFFFFLILTLRDAAILWLVVEDPLSCVHGADISHVVFLPFPPFFIYLMAGTDNQRKSETKSLSCSFHGLPSHPQLSTSSNPGLWQQLPRRIPRSRRRSHKG